MPDLPPIASITIDSDLQERFAAYSRDRNPLHMDPVAARRTQAGEPVVHGIHTMLWALDTLVGGWGGRIVSVKAQLLKWLYLGVEAELYQQPSDDPQLVSLQVKVREMVVMKVSVRTSGELAQTPASASAAVSEPLANAHDLTFAELAGKSGHVDVAPAKGSSELFPSLTLLIGGAAVAAIATCSYVVGMEAPGLHSVFFKLEVSLTEHHLRVQRDHLRYVVDTCDEVFRKIGIAINSATISGRLEAFVRAAPVKQAAVRTLTRVVKPFEFEGMRALVVGGSRGLGEITAKLIAAGGGASVLTYVLGSSEAEAVLEEIRAEGFKATSLRYDVRSAPELQLEGVGASLTHVFYFATNAFGRRTGELVSPLILEDFLQFYVYAFHDLCSYLMHPSAGSNSCTHRNLFVYYPSSLAIEERPEGMTEYAMAKAAGEQLCRDLSRHFPGLKIHLTRLPRLATDQTASVVPHRMPDAVDVMLPVVRAMMHMGYDSIARVQGV